MKWLGTYFTLAGQSSMNKWHLSWDLSKKDNQPWVNGRGRGRASGASFLRWSNRVTEDALAAGPRSGEGPAHGYSQLEWGAGSESNPWIHAGAGLIE